MTSLQDAPCVLPSSRHDGRAHADGLRHAVARVAASATGGNTNWGLSFSYDVYGNRTAQTVTAGSAPAFSASFGSNNRMVGYSYDNNGNQLTTPDGATLEYDADNRLTKWTKQGQVDQYQYHPSGWRLSKGSEKYLYGPGGQLLESYGGWNDITDYIYFGGRLLYTLSAGPALTRIYSDRLGSTRTTETIQQFGGGWTTRNYYPFGEEITSTSNDQYKFASTYRDSATGLDYAVNRYYASGMGSFLTTDPKFGSAKPERPQSWNRYTYAGNDPVNSIDPRGLNQDECQIPTTGDLIPDCLSGGGGSNGPCFIDPFYPVPDPYCAALILALPVAGQPRQQPAKRYAAGLRKKDDCYYENGYRLWVGYVRVVAYQVIDQFGDPYTGATVEETVTTTSGPEIVGGGVWTPSDETMRSNGTFEDVLTSNGNPQSTANQAFYSSGITLSVQGFGSPTTTLSNSYSPEQVLINGTATAQPCEPKKKKK